MEATVVAKLAVGRLQSNTGFRASWASGMRLR
ncbi:hypothetical protein QFZ64_001197 [Streptomyces sp. B3I8]|nr:hypothetical protein [Streptomyces sp. B3I8]